MNRETAISQTGLNAMNQYTPDGSLEYAQSGETWADGTPKFSVTQKLSDTNQQLYDLDAQTSINLGKIGVDQSDRIGKLLGSPMDLNVGAMPTGPDATTNRYALPGAQQMGGTAVSSRYAPDAMLTAGVADNSALEKQLIDLGNQRLTPQLQRQRADLDASLADKGIKQNSDAYSRSMTDFGQQENDARNQLILNGQQQAFQQALSRSQQDQSRYGQFWNQGAQKAQQDFGQDLAGNNQFFNQNMAGRQQYMTEAGANVANEQQQDQTAFERAQLAYTNAMQGRQQTIDEILKTRNQPINEISALMSGSQISTTPWTSTPQSSIASPDLMGMVQSNYAAKNQAYSGMLSGLGSLAGNALGFGLSKIPSDRRLKKNVRQVGTLHNGLPVYSFDYIAGGPTQIGLMAQDVEQIMPDAVETMPNGFKAVDYGMATESV